MRAVRPVSLKTASVHIRGEVPEAETPAVVFAAEDADGGVAAGHLAADASAEDDLGHGGDEAGVGDGGDARLTISSYCLGSNFTFHSSPFWG